MNGKYVYSHLMLVEPEFGSPLTDLILSLDYLRKKPLEGTTHPRIFFQLKTIFHFLESLESVRIEGNRTTIAELVERKIENESDEDDERFREIENIERAISFIEENVDSAPINRIFLSELHKLVVDHLSPEKEGDHSPGEYRKKNVKITKSAHTPPDFSQVTDYMEELIGFINYESAPKYDLLKMALAHHRFVWIHPFHNGNGRTVRLLTYAMLVKHGFNVKVGRILNPTAIFCNERGEYYDCLSKADSGDKRGLLDWCQYVLSGLKNEIEKIDKLLSHKFLLKEILKPAIDLSLERKIITDIEAKILTVAAEEQVFKAASIKKLFPQKVSSDISRILRGLKERTMIVPTGDGERKYYMSFYNNYLLRGTILMLEKNGFLPSKLEGLK